MKPVVYVVVGALLSVLAFPPFGVGPLILPGLWLLLTALRQTGSGKQGFWLGFLWGLVFWGGLMWWLGLLHLATLVLIPGQALFTGFFGWWLARWNRLEGAPWLLMAVGGWAIMELVRYRFPVGGMEWGAAGYAPSGLSFAMAVASVVGTTGLTVLLVAVSGLLVLEVNHKTSWMARLVVIVPVVLVLAAVLPNPFVAYDIDLADRTPFAIVQGSTPCPFEHCPPDERLRTFHQHLELTRTIQPGEVMLVVWPESSSGGVDADPVQNPEIRELVAEEARRLEAWIMLGTDRPVSETHWINANVLFDPTGEIVGEYRKQLPVPFGEWIPFRPFFTRLISDLSRVPRDMIPGEGPVIFDLPADLSTAAPYDMQMGSVISWEGGFSRFARDHARLGADILVVATNNDSYGPTSPTADQFIGMTRMRAAELGLPVVHAAVSGKSVMIHSDGRLATAKTTLGIGEVLYGEMHTGSTSMYARIGDVLMILAAASVPVVWLRQRGLVPSTVPSDEEE